MSRYRTIVAALDDSPQGRRALEQAATVAAACAAELVIVDAAPPLDHRQRRQAQVELTGTHDVPMESRLAEDRLRDGVDVARRAGAVSVTAVPARGELSAQLVGEARRRNADLIVVPTCEHSALGRVFGTVAHHVRRRSTADVLTVDCHEGPSRRALRVPQLRPLRRQTR